MTLMAAKSILISDRMDWRKPHLNWVSDKFYRHFTTFFRDSRDD